MTVPGGGYPDGTFDDDLSGLDGINEAAWKNQKLGGIGSFDQAHDNFKSEFISGTLFNGEVVRLDNRIDEIVIGSERALLYTYSNSDVWPKHPAAYKVIVDVLSPATGGRSASGSSGGVGGYSGGWERVSFTGAELEDLPSSVAVTIGAGLPGGSSAVGAASSFGTFVSVSAATPSNYGPGSRSYKMRGGQGGNYSVGSGGSPGTGGSAGPFNPGGSGGGVGNPGGTGGHGFSLSVGQIGAGSAAGGGGGSSGPFANGGNGGHGGWPSAPGGGAGAGGGGGGTAGNGAGGAVFVTVYIEDTLGIPPSTPTGLVASSVARNSARVSWTASIDDVAIKNYVLYLNGSRYGVVESLYWDFVGLTASTTYAVQIQAVDIGDNVSALSSTLNFTTTA